MRESKKKILYVSPDLCGTYAIGNWSFFVTLFALVMIDIYRKSTAFEILTTQNTEII